MAFDTPITAVQYGMGPIGCAIVRVADKAEIDFVGAVDIDPEKAGSDLGDVAGLSDQLGVDVIDDFDRVRNQNPDIVFHSTVSSLADAQPQLEEALENGAHVVSTCEELAYIWDNESVAAELDEVATDNGVCCLGTGINPGFVMDVLPAVASAPCQDVKNVSVTRIQDATTRRDSLQEKIGVGQTVESFKSEIVTEGGHIGLPESIAMLAESFGWEVEDIEENIDPVTADKRITSGYVPVEAGEVAGLKQVATATIDGSERIKLDEQMYVGATDPRDCVRITGTPDILLVIEGGYHGDVTTPAVVVNAAKHLPDADPGLCTMLDLQLPSYKAP